MIKINDTETKSNDKSEHHIDARLLTCPNCSSHGCIQQETDTTWGCKRIGCGRVFNLEEIEAMNKNFWSYSDDVSEGKKDD